MCAVTALTPRSQALTVDQNVDGNKDPDGVFDGECTVSVLVVLLFLQVFSDFCTVSSDLSKKF